MLLNYVTLAVVLDIDKLLFAALAPKEW